MTTSEEHPGARLVTWTKPDDTTHSMIFRTDPNGEGREIALVGNPPVRWTSRPLTLAAEFAAAKVMAGCAISVTPWAPEAVYDVEQEGL